MKRHSSRNQVRLRRNLHTSLLCLETEFPDLRKKLHTRAPNQLNEFPFRALTFNPYQLTVQYLHPLRHGTCES